MRRANLSVVRSVPAAAGSPRRRSLGQVLVENGVLDPGALAKAQALLLRQDARFEAVLLHNLMVNEADLYGAMSQQYGSAQADLVAQPPDPRLIDMIGVKRCIAEGLTPWCSIGGATVIATSRPDEFEAFRATLPAGFGPVLMAVAPLSDVQTALMQSRLGPLTQAAETRVAATESCRGWDAGRMTRLTLAAILGFASLAIVAPVFSFSAVCIWAILTLILASALKLSAAIVQVRHVARRSEKFKTRRRGPTIARLPTVSIMVPLFREREIASYLIRRLKRLNYPKELLDVLLVVESDDQTTRDTLTRTDLPSWVRTVVVPEGRLRTKPRALNYALDFCAGSIIGVYDAEDAPHPDQIHAVVNRFHERGPEVACLQGMLDFYNSRSNWLSRCFTIEYATWFRIILPGLQRLGLAIPLGGTTLFFRRKALEDLGGWDAHNVTEDADLGIRLARHGLRAEVLETVTEEEANCRPLPWIKQRSRWLKGYAITWAVHMRRPRHLLRQLGWRKFIGFQILFLGTLSQFLLTPVLWSFWMVPLGLPHPLSTALPGGALAALGAIFVLSEAITITVGLLAVSGSRHRFLMIWVPTLHLYFPLGALASYKAFYELLTRPFYWDKTAHGVFARTQPADAAEEAPAPTAG